jgi:hypothetical protein
VTVTGGGKREREGQGEDEGNNKSEGEGKDSMKRRCEEIKTFKRISEERSVAIEQQTINLC